MPRKKSSKSVDAFTHGEASRKNIPTAEHESVLPPEHEEVKELRYPRNTDLDPQLVWRGKDEKDWSDLVVPAPPLYIQEKVHPKVLIDDLMRASEDEDEEDEDQVDLFSDFNGIPEGADKTDFYEHDQNWSNRMILGDSLQVMASLAEREGLRGKVQCIYFDPPYGIKFNSNFQWSTTSRDVKDGKAAHITREPEQVKAFRDTWRDGIHSYLTYLRDRVTLGRDLLAEAGSIFVQIGDENVHRVRAILDEVFGEENYVNTIVFKKKSATYTTETVFDYLLWYAKKRGTIKVRSLFKERAAPEGESKFNTIITPDYEKHRVAGLSGADVQELLDRGGRWARVNYPIVSQHPSETRSGPYRFQGREKVCGRNKQWRFDPEEGMPRLERADRMFDGGGASLGGVVYWDDWNRVSLSNIWDDIHGEKFPSYVVQTATAAVERCVLMTTDPGDLVLDPTCGSGTTAFVAEQWGRRWITVDTSRVALALARARLMGGLYPYYLLADSAAGQIKEAALSRTAPSTKPTHGEIRGGFVYGRVPRITLKSIAKNAEIDVIWAEYEGRLDAIRHEISDRIGMHLEEWRMPRNPGDPWPRDARAQHDRFYRVTTDATRQKAVDEINRMLDRDYTIDTLPETPVDDWSDAELVGLHQRWWELRTQRQKEIDASIAAKADFEYLFDDPHQDSTTLRVAGPFTVESLSPLRTMGVDENDELIDPHEVKEGPGDYAHLPEFGQMVLQNLQTAGVQQAQRDDRIEFTSLRGWPGESISAEGRYQEGATEKRAGIFIGPEFGTVRRSDLVDAAREAGDADFDVVIACAFSYDSHASDFDKLGRVPVLKARMNADLHMADELKNTGSGNLFVIFGEPDIDLLDVEDEHVQVKINGVDVFDPSTGEVRSDDVEGIACWFVDTDYNGESFFVRHAYFLGANDPYKALKTTLKAEIDEDAWATLNSDVSRAFPKPESGRVAVKVINHLGDEVMKVFRIE